MIYVVMECSNYGSWPLKAFKTLRKAKQHIKKENLPTAAGHVAAVWYAVERIKLEE